ncbi:hypothetical protein GCQ56_05055 [Marinifilum sp. N1E240]|uniref:hypothetical protein n=1 Tax=Marinifilum sp. N1E240 TaxID=2608082 RepID=UPI00128DAC80|nr:hypothetical protein [Marinifilum sp. N1E240]MPQ46371.1 hypothetical protein [Marinifilum sp. N1E240]
MGFFNATAIDGEGFVPNGNPNEYKMTIYTGGFAGKGTATRRLEKEIDKFLKTTDFNEHQIVDSKFKFIPSGFTYTIRFK